jgi:hypothetical protein
VYHRAASVLFVTFGMMQVSTASSKPLLVEQLQFDRANGFEQHVKRDHNMWHYLFLVIHLRSKVRMEMDGLELLVWNAIRDERNLDISWVPLQRAFVLSRFEEKSDDQASLERLVKQLMAASTAQPSPGV